MEVPGARRTGVGLLENNKKCKRESSRTRNHPSQIIADNTQEQSDIRAPSKIISRLSGLNASPFDPDNSEPETQAAKRRTRSRKDSIQSRPGILSDQRRQLIELANRHTPTKNAPKKRTWKPPQPNHVQRTKKGFEKTSPSQAGSRRLSLAEAMKSGQKTRMDRQSPTANISSDQHKRQPPARQKTAEDQDTAMEGASQTVEEQVDQNEQEDRPLSPLKVGDYTTSDWPERAKRKFRNPQSSTASGSNLGNVVTRSASKTLQRKKQKPSVDSDPETPLRRSSRIAKNRMQAARPTRSATKIKKTTEATQTLDTSVRTRRKKAVKTKKGQEGKQASRKPTLESRVNEDEASTSGEYFDARDYLSSSN
ncbi:MAG: hypothetical protein LQ351_004934 [Letrouitia transgressa]|nr:MAG: hypothetical protein LQ351_004934 [Letrouitia transgressa]